MVTMIPMIWDMEIGNDPDDVLTLILLLGHPQVELKAVTVTPGTPDQIGLVRHMLALFERDIPVGVFNIASEKRGVSDWYYEVYGQMAASHDAEYAPDLLIRLCDADTTLVTGGPLRNLATAIKQPIHIGRWVCQGGFAGEGVVPAEKQLPQFKGLTTSPTTNLNAHPKSTLAALAYPDIGVKHFVSKNVCHGVIYDQVMHEQFAAIKDRSLSHALIWQGMDVFLKVVPDGKKFHDPLAACCAIDEGIGEWAEVEIYREKNEWGARLAEGSGLWIITDYDAERFFSTLTATRP